MIVRVSMSMICTMYSFCEEDGIISTQKSANHDRQYMTLDSLIKALEDFFIRSVCEFAVVIHLFLYLHQFKTTMSDNYFVGLLRALLLY